MASLIREEKKITITKIVYCENDDRFCLSSKNTGSIINGNRKNI